LLLVMAGVPIKLPGMSAAAAEQFAALIADPTR